MNKASLILAKTGSRALKMIAEGFDFEQVDEQEARRRLSICEGCPLLTDLRQCSVCGCEVDFKVTLNTNPILTVFKAEKTTNECPKGEW